MTRNNAVFRSNAKPSPRIFSVVSAAAPTKALLFLSLLLLPMLRVRAMSTTASSKTKLVLHWFRHGDLRLHDNPALMHSKNLGKDDGSNVAVLPIFCYDGTIFGQSNTTPLSGSLKCGARRAKFIQESVLDLRTNLQAELNSPLLVTHGKPAAAAFDEVLGKLEAFGADVVGIVCQEEVAKEEQDTVKAVEQVLQSKFSAGKMHTVWGSTMYDIKDLPFQVDLGLIDMPDVFTPFRNIIEEKSIIQKPLLTPYGMNVLPSDSATYQALEEYLSNAPSLTDLGYSDDDVATANEYDKRGVMKFPGGETAALARVKDYIWDSDLLRVYFETRNGMLGADYSTKFSPWLAHGNLSPRYVAAQCKKYEEQRIKNKSTYWLVFELLWRDYCKFFALKHGSKIFFPYGTNEAQNGAKWSTDEKNFEAWKEGMTGYPLVDANMREMKATGFMSNRGRQNVASFLAIDLCHDWRFGGDWFESNLIDYDVYSNWVVSVTW
jgi:deoxyribodipyrimidine photo-lyase